MVILRRHWPLLGLVLGAVLVLIAGLVILSSQRAAPGTAVLPAPSPIISSEPSPSTASSPAAGPSPSTTSTPVDGMRIQLPELGIDLPVVAGDGVNAPLYKAVLDPFLAQPGSGSRSMIYAHARNGMFGPLFRTRLGEHVVIRRPGQADLTYVITNYYPHWPVNDLSPLQPMAKEQLVLVTCTTYNLNDPRQVVYASPA